MSRREYERWLALAEQDRLLIRNELNAEEVPWNLVGFHAQQAAEKYLKGFLVFHDAEPVLTHNLRILLNHAITFDPSLRDVENVVEDLDYYGVDARYDLDIEDEFSEDAARVAIAASDRICAAIRDRMTSGNSPN